MSTFVKVAGTWQPVTSPWAKVGGQWFEATRMYGKVNGAWHEVYPGDGIPPDLPAGTYVLGASSISLPTSSQFGFAEFVTDDYRGRITEISIILSWRNAGEAISQIDTGGRPNNNFYRAIENVLREWDGRTITHRIDSFDASSLTDFNSGAAIGFNLNSFYLGQRIGNLISNVQLQFVIV